LRLPRETPLHSKVGAYFGHQRRPRSRSSSLVSLVCSVYFDSGFITATAYRHASRNESCARCIIAGALLSEAVSIKYTVLHSLSAV
jgi:hypothetical protein